MSNPILKTYQKTQLMEDNPLKGFLLLLKKIEISCDKIEGFIRSHNMQKAAEEGEWIVSILTSLTGCFDNGEEIGRVVHQLCASVSILVTKSVIKADLDRLAKAKQILQGHQVFWAKVLISKNEISFEDLKKVNKNF